MRRGHEKDEDEGSGGATVVANGKGVEEDFAEQQRRMMRVALARHMKRELIENEQDRLTKVCNAINASLARYTSISCTIVFVRQRLERRATSVIKEV